MRRFFYFRNLSKACIVAPLLQVRDILANSCPRFHYSSDRSISQEEMHHLEQQLPPPELLTELRSSDATLSEDADIPIPGDSFGIMRNRVAFYKPIPRQTIGGPIGEHMPKEAHPLLCINPNTVRFLCGFYGLSELEVIETMRQANCNINETIHRFRKMTGVKDEFGGFGLVCLEAYAPEAFCLVSYSLPDYETIFDDDVLDAVHELTLSAAEMPLDLPHSRLVDKFLNDWTIEDGTPCTVVLDQYNIAVKDIILLPYGDYSVQGFHILHPIKKDTPNIGVAAAACCMDLRTGIHNRFRFHVERIADTISEHVLQEMIHYNQGVHLLRQPFWFCPEYSVEEFIRFKESLLQPSASIFEMRYAAVFSLQYGLNSFRNIIELEKLKIAQHKYEKHYENFTAPGNWLTSDHSQLQSIVGGGGGSNAPGGALHLQTNQQSAVKNAMETRVGPLRRNFENSIQKHGDYVFNRFYHNNFH